MLERCKAMHNGQLPPECQEHIKYVVKDILKEEMKPFLNIAETFGINYGTLKNTGDRNTEDIQKIFTSMEKMGDAQAKTNGDIQVIMSKLEGVERMDIKLDKIADTKEEIHHYVDESRIEIAESRGEIAEVRGELKVVSDNVNLLLKKSVEAKPDDSFAKSVIKKIGKRETLIIVIVVGLAIIGTLVFVGYKVNKVINDVNDATTLIQSVKGE